tara:strand:+ start:1553 stop:1936 length:384 start_codon:yes stop_codon:yes gene_type:complete
MSDKIYIREERHRNHAIETIKALDIATVYEVTIKPYKRNRSLEQNSLMWKWYSIIADDLGYTTEEIHEEFMRKLLIPITMQTPSGMVEVYSTKKLKVKEMTAYLEGIERTATEMGISLPRPYENNII